MKLEGFFETNTIQELMQREDVRVITLKQCGDWQALAVNVTEADGVSLLGTVVFVPSVDVSEITTEPPSGVKWN